MKVVGYLRVSTDRQVEEGLGLEIQERSIREWAESNGHTIVAMFRDEGLSGSNGIDTRLDLGDALAALREGQAEALVVAKLDRLARDLIVQEQLLADVWAMKCQVFSCSPAEGAYLSNDPDDPSRALIRQVLGAVSQYERSMIAMRLRAGRKRKREHGGFGGGTPPFGWRNVEGVGLVEDEREQAVIARIRDLRAEGRTLAQIAESLESDGIRSTRSNRWHPQTVRVVLARVGP